MTVEPSVVTSDEVLYEGGNGADLVVTALGRASMPWGEEPVREVAYRHAVGRYVRLGWELLGLRDGRRPRRGDPPPK